MKKTMLLLLALVSTQTWAATDIKEVCSKQFGDEVLTTQAENLRLLGSHCLIKNYVTSASVDMKLVDEFLKLEKEVGENSYDVHHVNEFNIYGAKNAFRLSQRNIDYKMLKEMANFSLSELTPYAPADIYEDSYSGWSYLDVLRYAKILNRDKLKEFFTYIFADKDPEIMDEDMTAELQKKVTRRAAIYDQAIEALVTLALGSDSYVTSYPLLDNNNENVQDAEWTLVSSKYVIIFNKFYWL